MILLPLQWDRHTHTKLMQTHLPLPSDLCLPNLKETLYRSQLRDLGTPSIFFFWRPTCLGLTLLQTTGSHSPQWIIYVWRNGPGLQRSLLTLSAEETERCFSDPVHCLWLTQGLCIWERNFHTQSRCQKSLQTLRSIMYQCLDWHKIKSSIFLPGCWDMDVWCLFCCTQENGATESQGDQIRWIRLHPAHAILLTKFCLCSLWFSSSHFWAAVC